MTMTTPIVSEFEVNDKVNPVITLRIDRDADLDVVSYDLVQEHDHVFVTLDGLRALVAAAEQLPGKPE